MRKTVLPTPRIRDSVIKLIIKRQVVGRELITWEVFGQPVCLGDLSLKKELVFDLFGRVRTLKDFGMSRDAIREGLMRYVHESSVESPTGLFPDYREETWFAQSARLIDALLSYHFRDQAA